MHERRRAATTDDEVAAALCDRFAGSVFFASHGQSVVYLERSHLADAAQYLRDEEQFTMCVDVTAVDHLVDGVRHAPPASRPSASRSSPTSSRTPATGACA